MRNPRRTAATASALVLGLGLVGLVAVFGASAKSSVRRAVDRGIRADVVLKGQQFAGFSSQVGERVAATPGVEAVAAFRFGLVLANGDEGTLAGVDPTGLTKTVALHVRRGSIRALEDNAVLVHQRTAERYDLVVGDEVGVQAPFFPQSLRVVGIYDQEDFTGGLPVQYIVNTATFEQGFGPDEQLALVYASTTRNGVAARTAIADALRRDFPNVDVLTRREYRSDQERGIDRFLAVTVALLLLSEIIAVLGIVNTLALSVFERTRELGLLRSIGMSRRQVRRMIRGESVVVALIGGVVGAAIGLAWGWAFAEALEGEGITSTSIPGWQLAVFIVASMLAGVAAAIGPAWRASRLDVLDAIATE